MHPRTRSRMTLDGWLVHAVGCLMILAAVVPWLVGVWTIGRWVWRAVS